MKITTLLENTAVDDALDTHHGLSQYIEVNGRKILLDAGRTPATVANANYLGIDLTGVDTCILSHGHYDHADGFPAVLALNQIAPLYLKPQTRGRQMAGFGADCHYIGLSPALVEDYGHRLRFVAEDTDLEDGITLLTHITPNPAYTHPQPNLQVEAEGVCTPDPFLHELIVTIQEGDGIHILTGCSHSGIVAMVETVMAKFPHVPIRSVTGGFHLMVTPHQDKMACTPDFAHQIGDRLKELGDFTVLTCHCTGQLAFDHLQSRLGDRITYLRGGMTVEI